MPRDPDAPPDEYDPGFDPPPRRRPPGRGGNRALLWVFGGLGCMGLLGCAGVAGLVWWLVRPTTFPEQTEDYAVARKAFRTTLTTAGPAPQEPDPVDTPDPADGADLVAFKSGDLPLTAWASKPPADGKRRPGVLYLHGGFAFGRADWDETRPLRDAGFAVLVPTLRGENHRPGHFSLFCDEVGDCLAAADALAARPGVDPDRLFVAGFSAGGTLAMLTAMADGRFKGCGAISGSPDQHKFLQFGGVAAPFDPADAREVAIRSPLAWPRSFKCPARLYVGSEELPDLLATRELAEQARAAGRDVVCEELEGDHHEVVGPALDRVVTFFQGRR